MKTNYKLIFDKAAWEAEGLEKKPRLLLHACCAPCSSAVLEEVCRAFEVTLFFYNPNIFPEKEFVFRLRELDRLVRETGREEIEIVAPDYCNDEFEAVIKGFEENPEGGERCRRCYRLRLERAVSFAAEQGFDYVTTTLSVSPHKNARWLNEIGMELGEKYGIKYLCSDFKKNDGYKRSCELSREMGLYRQDYCGCVYSKAEAEKRKALRDGREGEKSLEIKTFDYLPQEARDIREEVFIREQGFCEEYDETDKTATHIVLFEKGEAIATCRVFVSEEEGRYILGRLAVKKSFRGKGVGSLTLKGAEEHLQRIGARELVLHSQLQAREFYIKNGYCEYGEVEYEEDCPHIWMRKNL